MAEPTIEERLAALEETVAALVAQDADDYSLRYSGEEVDQALDYTLALTEEPTDVNTVVGRDKAVKPAWTAAKMNEVLTNCEGLRGYALINGASDRTFSLSIVRRHTVTGYNVSANSTVWLSGSIQDAIPDGMRSYTVLASSDGGGEMNGWHINDLTYKVVDRRLDWYCRLYNGDANDKSGMMTLDFIIIGLRDGEGVIQL